MKKRLDALTRIGRFQALMHDLGRWRLHSLDRERAGLADDLKAVFESSSWTASPMAPQAGLAARHIRALQRKLDQLVHEQETARRTALSAWDARKACRAGDRYRRSALSASQGAQGAGRADRAGDRASRRKLDIRLARGRWLAPLATNDGAHGFQSSHRCRHGGSQRGRSVPRQPRRPAAQRACGLERAGRRVLRRPRPGGELRDRGPRAARERGRTPARAWPTCQARRTSSARPRPNSRR